MREFAGAGARIFGSNRRKFGLGFGKLFRVIWVRGYSWRGRSSDRGLENRHRIIECRESLDGLPLAIGSPSKYAESDHNYCDDQIDGLLLVGEKSSAPCAKVSRTASFFNSLREM